MPPLALTRLNITKPEAGIVRVVSGGKVTVYDTMLDGSSPVLEDGTVQDGAVKTLLYSDRGGILPVDNPITTDALGLIEFFSSRGEVHLQIVSVDNTKFGIPWMPVGGFPALDVGEAHADIRDYATLNLAIASLGSTTKGVVHCHSGTYHADSYKGAIKRNTIIPANVSLKGVGHRGAVTTFLLNDGNDPNADWFTLQAYGAQKIEGIYFRGLRDSIGSSTTGRLFILDGCNGTCIKGCFMDQICGIGLETVFTSGIDNVNLFIEESQFQATGYHCIKLASQTFHTILLKVGTISYNGHCIWTKGQNNVFYACAIEPNDDTYAAINIDGARQFAFHNTWFEYNPAKAPPTNPPPTWFIELNNAPALGSYGNIVTGCRFVRIGPNSLRAIRMNGGNNNVVFDNNIGIMGNGVSITGTDDILMGASDNIDIRGRNKIMTDNGLAVGDFKISGNTPGSLFPGYLELPEISAPTNPAADRLRLYVKDVAGVTRLFYRDAAGNERQVNTTP